MGIHIVGGARTVVEAGGLKIDELAGNVATRQDTISVAHVTISSPTAEPWLTLDYDEWICVMHGRMVLEYEDGKSVEVKAGQTVMVERGTRFRPHFPEAGTEYIPVCLPAFRPDRCLREDTNDSEQSAISKRLAALHNEAPKAGEKCAPLPEVLYHMCQVSLWEAAKTEGRAYFPPTFDEDGKFTHATGVPSRLIETANHFYQEVTGEWVCLRFTRSNLRSAGIVVRDEHALPVGETPIGESWDDWVCPHIVGGIPPAVVDAEMPMVRDEKGRAFLAIDGLVQNGKA